MIHCRKVNRVCMESQHHVAILRRHMSHQGDGDERPAEVEGNWSDKPSDEVGHIVSKRVGVSEVTKPRTASHDHRHDDRSLVYMPQMNCACHWCDL